MRLGLPSGPLARSGLAPGPGGGGAASRASEPPRVVVVFNVVLCRCSAHLLVVLLSISFSFFLVSFFMLVSVL